MERAERERIPLCDEAHLQVFKFWYEMGGMRRPLSPMEAAETDATLAKDFIYLIRRMRALADSETKLGEFVSKHLWGADPTDDLNHNPALEWETYNDA